MDMVSYSVQLDNRIEAITRELNCVVLSDADTGRQLAIFLQDVGMTILGDKEHIMLAEKFNKAMNLFAKRCVGFGGFNAFAETCRNPNSGLSLAKRIVFG